MALEVPPNVSSTTKTMGHHKQEGIDKQRRQVFGAKNVVELC